MTGQRVLAVRMGALGDVLMAGPAIRQLAARAGHVTLLASPAGAPAAELLPGVDEVWVSEAPWQGSTAPATDPAGLTDLLERARAAAFDVAIIFTSFHQSPLPLALLAKWAGVPRVAGYSDDDPGSLLDVRGRRLAGRDDDGVTGQHEVDAMCRLAVAAGYPRPVNDDGRLRIRPRPPAASPAPYVVVHPTASVPSRSMTARQAARIVRALRADRWDVVVTGAEGDEIASAAARHTNRDLTGKTTFAELASVFAGAACVIAPNTGPAHLAVAVRTPLVCLFAPVVPAGRWAPRGRDVAVLGDQRAQCAGTGARQCPIPGHPCLTGVADRQIVDTVRVLTQPSRGRPARVTA